MTAARGAYPPIREQPSAKIPTRYESVRIISMPTRAITIKQPWATCIAASASNSPHGKTVENRTKPDPWRSAIGERIAIHAGKGWDQSATKHPMFWKLADGSEPGGIGPAFGWLTPTFHHSGQVIATGVLADVHRCDGSCSPWADPDQWHLVWQDMVLLDPFPARGALGLWRLPAPPASDATSPVGTESQPPSSGEDTP